MDLSGSSLTKICDSNLVTHLVSQLSLRILLLNFLTDIIASESVKLSRSEMKELSALLYKKQKKLRRK